MSDCLFCKILSKEIPSEVVFENEKVYAFKDIYPQAREHYLFIHREHTANINDLTKSDPSQLVDLFEAIREFTEVNDLSKDGFRVVTNMGKNGCQTVFHTHLHVLGGEQLRGFGA